MDRRQFLKLVGAFAGATALPVSLAVTVVLEPVIDEELLMEAWKTGASPDGDGFLAVCDLDKMWRAVHLRNKLGDEWRTDDGGQTWWHTQDRGLSWNRHSFNVEGDISWA